MREGAQNAEKGNNLIIFFGEYTHQMRMERLCVHKIPMHTLTRRAFYAYIIYTMIRLYRYTYKHI